MKLDQHVCLDEISLKFENWSCLVENYATRSNLEKHCVCSRGNIFSLIIMKLGQNVCLDEVSEVFENGSCWVKK